MRFDSPDEARLTETLAIHYLSTMPIGSGDPVEVRKVRELRDRAQMFNVEHLASDLPGDGACSLTMVTARTFAEQHGVAEQTVTRWCRAEWVAARQSGGVWLIPADAEVDPRGRQSSLPRGSTRVEG